MSFKKKMKQHIDSTLEQYVPNPYANTYKPTKAKFPLWAKISAPVGLAAAAIAVAIALIPKIGFSFGNNSNGMVGLANCNIGHLANTHIDMSDVKGFAICTESDLNAEAKNAAIKPRSNLRQYNAIDTTKQSDWKYPSDWSQSTKSVLVAILKNNTIKEVSFADVSGTSYTQDSIGYVTELFSTDNFTFVQFVNEESLNSYLQNGRINRLKEGIKFTCDGMTKQTIVIHNETGTIRPLEEAGSELRYTADFLNGDPFVGRPHKGDYFSTTINYTKCWLRLSYNELEGIVFENVFRKCVFNDNNRMAVGDVVKKDNFGKEYSLYSTSSVKNLDSNIIYYSSYGNTSSLLACRDQNQILAGDDGYMYAFYNGCLCRFNNYFELKPVTLDKSRVINFEGLHIEEAGEQTPRKNGTVYQYYQGYLFSAWGSYREIASNGEMGTEKHFRNLSFPKYLGDAFLWNGMILALVDCRTMDYVDQSLDGRLVQYKYIIDDNGNPNILLETIMDAHAVYANANTLYVEESTNDNNLFNYYTIENVGGDAVQTCVVRAGRNGYEYTEDYYQSVLIVTEDIRERY